MNPKISRVWAMPNKWTFKIKPITELLQRYNVGDGWADPFAGRSRLAEYRNDLNPNNGQEYCLEATEFLSQIPNGLRGVVFDPPYSLTQVSRSYNDIGLEFKGKENPTGGFPKAKDKIAALLDESGTCISFGWNTIGLGKKRGFEIIEILIVSHGGNRNDTLVTVERRIKQTKDR